MLKRLLPSFFVLVILAGLLLAAWPWRNYVVPLRIGIEGNYPPFSKTESDGTVSGLEIDWAHQFCAKMRARCTLIPLEFDQLIPELKGGRIDAIMASLSITAKRRKEVDFSDSYYDVPSAWLARTGAIHSVLPGGLMVGKSVAVLKGSPRESWVAANYPEMKLVPVAKETDGYALLAEGKVEMAFTSLLVAKTKFLPIPEGRSFAVVGQPTWLGNSDGGVGVALRQEDDTLRRRFNRAIAAAIESGEYKIAANRYVDFDLKERK